MTFAHRRPPSPCRAPVPGSLIPPSPQNINEFLYGIRKLRNRTKPTGEEEEEPLLYFFWQASQHGVPHEKHIHADDFDFYVDLLGITADVIGSEHTLKMKGGAFWNMFGSMQEIQIPVFVLVNVAMAAFGKSHPALAEKLKTMITNKAKAFMKLCKDPKTAPKPCESYHPTILGLQASGATMDSRGHLPLELFLREALATFRKQRLEDAVGLNVTFQTWYPEGCEESAFDAFTAMLLHAKPEIQERDVIELFTLAVCTAYNPLQPPPTPSARRHAPHSCARPPPPSRWTPPHLISCVRPPHRADRARTPTRTSTWSTSSASCASGVSLSRSSPRQRGPLPRWTPPHWQ